MAKVPVGGANGLIDRLLILVGWKATAVASDAERVDALNALNYAEKFIAQSEALSYLDFFSTLAVAGSGLVAIPSDCDYGKDYAIENAEGTDVIAFKPKDEFSRYSSSTYDRVATTPFVHTIIIDSADSTLKFRFKPAVAATLNITYQKIPPALTDAGGSFSMLPEGYELTILLTVAEQYIKRRKHALDADFLDAEGKAMLGMFYDKFRSSKQSAMTDQSREKRKIEEDRLAPGV